MLQICKNIWTKTVMKGFILASDIWVSDPKLTFFAYFRIFKLLVEYEETHATERYLQLNTHSVKEWFFGMSAFDVKFD